jgi:hypothetical protein
MKKMPNAWPDHDVDVVVGHDADHSCTDQRMDKPTMAAIP